jgi:hypothetical protein
MTPKKTYRRLLQVMVLAVLIGSPAAAQLRASDAWVQSKIDEMRRDPLGAQILRSSPEALDFYRRAVREAGAARDAGGTERDQLLTFRRIGQELQKRYVLPVLRRASAAQLEKVWDARERFLSFISTTDPAICVAALTQELLPQNNSDAPWRVRFREMSQAIATALQDGLARTSVPERADKDAIDAAVARLKLSGRDRSILDGELPGATSADLCKAQVALGQSVKKLPRSQRTMVIRELLFPAN